MVREKLWVSLNNTLLVLLRHLDAVTVKSKSKINIELVKD